MVAYDILVGQYVSVIIKFDSSGQRPTLFPILTNSSFFLWVTEAFDNCCSFPNPKAVSEYSIAQPVTPAQLFVAL